MDGHLCSNASIVIAAAKPEWRKNIVFNVANNLCRVCECLKSFLTHSKTRLVTRFELHSLNNSHMTTTLRLDDSLGKQKGVKPGIKRHPTVTRGHEWESNRQMSQKRFYVFSLVWTNTEKGKLFWHATVEKAAWDITVAPSRVSHCQMMGFSAHSRGPSWFGTRTRADAIWWWRARTEWPNSVREIRIFSLFSHIFSCGKLCSQSKPPYPAECPVYSVCGKLN